MKLTPEQQAMLDGAQGETMAKVVKTLVMYGDAFGAERMVPITSKCGHTVISFGLKAIQPVYDLYDQITQRCKGQRSDQVRTGGSSYPHGHDQEGSGLSGGYAP